MRLLASKKIDINKPYELPGNFGMASMHFPLWFAARSCMSEKYVRLLLAQGANPLVTPCAPRKLSEAMKMDMHSIEASLYQFELALDKHYSSLFSMKPKESKEVLQARKIILATIKDIVDEAEKNYSTKPDDLSMPLSKVSLHI
jgi:hypothetical protein